MGCYHMSTQTFLQNTYNQHVCLQDAYSEETQPAPGRNACLKDCDVDIYPKKGTYDVSWCDVFRSCLFRFCVVDIRLQRKSWLWTRKENRQPQLQRKNPAPPRRHLRLPRSSRTQHILLRRSHSQRNPTKWFQHLLLYPHADWVLRALTLIKQSK